MSIQIEALEFDEDNLSEIEAHGITMEQVVSVLEGQPKFFRNKKGAAGLYLMVGPDTGGAMLSVPIARTARKGVWRPITAWTSSTGQITRWRRSH